VTARHYTRRRARQARRLLALVLIPWLALLAVYLHLP
jgi:hypothetical protein